MFRHPANVAVVGQHPVFELRGANEPAVSGVLDQGVVFRTPAEGVIVGVLFLVEEQAAFTQSSGNGFVGVFDPLPCILWKCFGELAIGTDCADQLGAFTVTETRAICL